MSNVLAMFCHAALVLAVYGERARLETNKIVETVFHGHCILYKGKYLRRRVDIPILDTQFRKDSPVVNRSCHPPCWRHRR